MCCTVGTEPLLSREEIGKYRNLGGCSSALVKGLFGCSHPSQANSQIPSVQAVSTRSTRGGKVEKPLPLESVGMRKDEEINSPFERK